MESVKTNRFEMSKTICSIFLYFRVSLIYIIILLLFIINGSIYAKQSIYNDYLDLISIERVKKVFEILASDELLGRGTGQKGEILASEYIANELAKYSINPLGYNGTYFQYIPFHSAIPLANSEFKFHTKETTIDLNLFQDYILFKSGGRTFLPIPTDMVFVGYGIVAPEYDYNDYYNIDVKGKIVVMLEDEPYSEHSEYFNAEIPTVYSHPISKQRIAISRGAIGSIIIPHSFLYKKTNWESIKQSFEFPSISLASDFSNHLSIILHPQKAIELFENSKYTFFDILEMHLNNRVKSFEIEPKLTFRGNFKKNDFLGRNIVSMVEGSDSVLKHTYVIVSAHYDGFGIGPEFNGDSIYNGALDNALGVSVMLELAYLFKNMKIKPKRSLIFLFTTAEEQGLLGSQFYTENPIVPLHKTIANINIDGIAFIDEFNSVIGVGSQFSELGAIFNKTTEEQNLYIQSFPPEFREDESFNRSDQISFAKAGVPAILVLDGTDYKNISSESGTAVLTDYFLNIYHKPIDDTKQAINYKAVLQHSQLLLGFIYNTANSINEPLFYKHNQFYNTYLRNQAEKR